MHSFAFIYVSLFASYGCDVIGGYDYPHPEVSTPSTVYLPPFFQDDVPPTSNVPQYVPPMMYPQIEEENTVIFPPDPSNTYLPPIYSRSNAEMKVLNMSCAVNGFFKCVFRVAGGFERPVVEESREDCVKSIGSDAYEINLAGDNEMTRCGVKTCAFNAAKPNMCLTVRMPTVKNVKLPEDGLVTFHCSPQEDVATHTRHVKLATHVLKGRANTEVVAKGGNQRYFKTNLILLRKSPRSRHFDQQLGQEASVRLGEELLMRIHVNAADGWKYSHVGPVVIRGASTGKSAVLIDENGCRNVAMGKVCPLQPQRVTPLETAIEFRAFLFQNAPPGDEMTLSVQMRACMDARDCYKNIDCDVSNLNPTRVRRQLHTQPNATNMASTFSFKVEEELFEKNRRVVGDDLIIKIYGVLCVLIVFVAIVSIYVVRLCLIKK